jgi:hypothetical protein
MALFVQLSLIDQDLIELERKNNTVIEQRPRGIFG